MAKLKGGRENLFNMQTYRIRTTGQHCEGY
jgi:hypothetical protein